MDGSKQQVEGYVTDIITDKALDWLKNQRDKNKPFVLMCQHKAPHRNWVPAPRHYHLFDGVTMPEPPTFFDDYANRSKVLTKQQMNFTHNIYWGWDMLLPGEPKDPRFLAGLPNGEFKRMTPAQQTVFTEAYASENQKLFDDLAAGKLSDSDVSHWKYQRFIKDYLSCVRALDENIGRVLDYLDQSGLAKNTVVIYSSDQGFYLGEHGWYDKRWMFEESLSMPFLIRWPGVVNPGIRSKAMIQNIDYAPTFLEIAGVKVPGDMQGRSLLPVLKNDGIAPDDWRKAIYYAYYGEATHHVAAHDGVRTDRYKLFYLPDTKEWQMFDLQQDPQELKDVHADPERAAVFSEMKGIYQNLRTQYQVK